MISVSEEILKQATHCQKNLNCLTGQAGGQCKVKLTLESVPFLKVNRANGEPCPYSFHYENSHFCTCPVRHELFHRYGI